MDELISRQMPPSAEAEQAVLGSMLINEQCIHQVMEALKSEDFYLRGKEKFIIRNYASVTTTLMVPLISYPSLHLS